MRITKVEKAAIAVTAVVVLLVCAFYLGRSTSDSGVTIENTSASVSSVIPVEAPVSEAAVTVPVVEESVASGFEEVLPSVIDEPQVETTASGILDLNTATAEQFETLPEIGPVLAQRIVDYREAIGGFVSVEELMNVSGIGEKTFASIKNLVEVVN